MEIPINWTHKQKDKMKFDLSSDWFVKIYKGGNSTHGYKRLVVLEPNQTLALFELLKNQDNAKEFVHKLMNCNYDSETKLNKMNKHELKQIMKKELKHEWRLEIKPYWDSVGWEGETLEDIKLIILFTNADNYFGAFLHELAHAIQIEKRPNMKLEQVHDVYYANTLTDLIVKYSQKKSKENENG